jgi:hypothetical protein
VTFQPDIQAPAFYFRLHLVAVKRVLPFLILVGYIPKIFNMAAAWQAYIQSMTDTGNVAQAAIIDNDGNVWAISSGLTVCLFTSSLQISHLTYEPKMAYLVIH